MNIHEKDTIPAKNRGETPTRQASVVLQRSGDPRPDKIQVVIDTPMKEDHITVGRWMVANRSMEKRTPTFYAMVTGFVLMGGTGIGIMIWIFIFSKPNASSVSASQTALVLRNTTGTGVVGYEDGYSASFNSPHGVAADSGGNIYVADTGINEIRKINASGYVSTLAGNATALPSYQDGQGSAARFNAPIGIAFDPTTGLLFVVDSNNSLIRQVAPNNTVSTVAGSTALQTGSTDGQSTAASFNNPYGIAMDSNQNLYVSDTGNNLVRQINASRYISTFAGISTLSRRISAALSTSLKTPLGIAVDSEGSVFVDDSGNFQILKINPRAGSINAVLNLTSSSRTAITVDKNNALWVSQEDSNILKIIPLIGTVQTVSAPTNSLTFLAFDPSGNIVSSISSMNVISLFIVVAPSFMALSVTAASVANLSFSTQPSGTVQFGSTFSTQPIVYAVDSFENPVSNASITLMAFTDSSCLLSGDGVLRNGTVQTSPTGYATFSTVSYSRADTIYLKATSGSITICSMSSVLVDVLVSTFAGSGSPGSADGQGNAATFYNPMGIASDWNGNIYVADNVNNMIRSITPGGLVSTFAGSVNAGADDGLGTGATFSLPIGLVVDAIGNVFVADSDNNEIRKITPEGLVSTFAGSTNAGLDDGQGTTATFYYPRGIAFDSNGNLYVGDYFNLVVRMIKPGGLVSTFAGSGNPGIGDGQGMAASFNGPSGVAVDASGNVYVVDEQSNMIRKITSSGFVSTLAGGTTPGTSNGQGSSARFFRPSFLTIDNCGNLYVTDPGNSLIRKITPSGHVSTYAGSGSVGATDGLGTVASFNYPQEITFDPVGNLYVADYNNNLIRKISFSETELSSLSWITSIQAESVIAGNYVSAQPILLLLDQNGASFSGASIHLSFFTDSSCSTRAASPGLFGNTATTNSSGFASFASLKYTAAGSYHIKAVCGSLSSSCSTQALNVTANTGSIFRFNSVPSTAVIRASLSPAPSVVFTDLSDNAVSLAIAPNLTAYTDSGCNTAVSAGTFSNGSIYVNESSLSFSFPYVSYSVQGFIYLKATSGLLSICSPVISVGRLVTTIAGSGVQSLADGVGAAASFNYPFGIVVDSNGTLYVADWLNNAIRMISPNGTVTTLSQSFNAPQGIDIDSAGTLYVGEYGGHRIRTISTIHWTDTTLAGSGTGTYADGVGVAASFYHPVGVAVDSSGIVLHQMELSGSGSPSFADGLSTAASFWYPTGIAVDVNGTVYVADQLNCRIRKITPGGLVSTLAGSGTDGFGDGVALAALFKYPSGLVVDSSGVVYVADQANSRIRMISTDGSVTTIAGSATSPFADGVGSVATFNFPADVALDSNGAIYVADQVNHN